MTDDRAQPTVAATRGVHGLFTAGKLVAGRSDDHDVQTRDSDNVSPMRFRLFTLLAAFALVMAACGGGGTGEDTTSTSEQTTTSQPGPDAVLLSYSLEPGTTYTYEVDLDQEITMTSEGDGAVAGNQAMPASMAIQLSGSTTFTHSVAEGPEPDTYEITITGEFSELNVDGTVDGEAVTPGEIPDVAEMPPIDVTIVVDEQGNVIPQADQTGDIFGGDLGALGALGGLEAFGPGSDLGRMIGPPLSDAPVTVGDTWSETIEVPMMMGLEGEPVTTVINSEVTGTDTIEGHDVLVIDTEMVTSRIEFDLAEFLIGFFQAFLPDDASDEERADLESLMATLFDAGAGLSRQADLSSATHLVMDLNMPDETSGEMMGFVMDMNIDQTVTYRLIDAAGA